MQNKKSKNIFILIIFLIGLYGYVFLNEKFSFSIPCVFKKITGYFCPGCGITRMLFSILKLDFYQAFRFNPLVFVLLISYLLFLLIKRFKSIKLSNQTTLVLLIITALFGILRNVEIFKFLQPVVV